jgi:hypothetical protein
MVEIKFIFTDKQIAKVQAAFGLAEPASLRTVGFFDTSDGRLLRGGKKQPALKLILRARFSPGKKHGKTTLKIRTSGKLDDSLQTDEAMGAKREFDFAYGRGLLDSYSLDEEQNSDEIAEVLEGQRGLKKIFGDRQQQLIKNLAGKAVSWPDLRIFGPVSPVQTWEDVRLPGFVWPMTFELWPLPAAGVNAARQILEFSMRTEVDQQIAAVDRLLLVLRKMRIRPATTETKTQTVLQHFSPGQPAKRPTLQASLPSTPARLTPLTPPARKRGLLSPLSPREPKPQQHRVMPAKHAKQR